MHSLLLIDKAEEAAQYSSEAPGDGRDSYTHGTVCQSVFAVVNVCGEEGDRASGGAMECRSRLSVHASLLLQADQRDKLRQLLQTNTHTFTHTQIHTCAIPLFFVFTALWKHSQIKRYHQALRYELFVRSNDGVWISLSYCVSVFNVLKCKRHSFPLPYTYPDIHMLVSLWAISPLYFIYFRLMLLK